MGVRYIGSKARVSEAIVDLAGPADDGRFVDAFCGTGAVAAAAAERGWAVTVNDSLPSAVCMSVGAVLGQKDVPFDGLGSYHRAIVLLNEVEGEPGFLHSHYSPASLHTAGLERRYFTEDNAARLDAMRKQIRIWSTDEIISPAEENLLLADLMQAANSVANISGTYGCFLKNWTTTARKNVSLTPRVLPDRSTDVHAVVGDVFALSTTEGDTVYFDPPYTKRQYSAYYHILETLHAGDQPEVGGITGLRPWQDKSSVFCYKVKALDALTRLVLGTRAKKILLSYSNEGHVAKESLLNALTEAGRVTVHEIKTIGRYRPNAQASAAGDTVVEYVFEIDPVSCGTVPAGADDSEAAYA
ncbi:DNA adenine methylase [Rhodococcus pyridinivorans]|uniref:DNA adenine methylase n=1 Tax=Rhodococcus pyridinivorans TaxID=103816 RepID=UPI002225BC8E|nr:DNA adenine methylase [Rhodococcus pyridinivorans]MCW3471860.1 DNA adenine methylase [Rhodococcus pyridinivorans]